MKLNVLFTAMAVLVLGLLTWNIYLLNTNDNLQKKVDEVKENYHYLDSYNKVIQYDLTTARDSVRILEEWIDVNENKIVVP
ncbi:MAG TPA: hypothetical protein VKY37_06280 [Brumimicrobium sp.]|nr:hypothetical protein [Brumimicrobium sp.]